MELSTQQALIGTFAPVVVSTECVPCLGEANTKLSYDVQIFFTDRFERCATIDGSLIGSRKVRGEISMAGTWWLEDKWTLRVPYHAVREFAQLRGVDVRNERSFGGFVRELYCRLTEVQLVAGPERVALSIPNLHVQVKASEG
jgi:hypothetical protein